MKMKRKQWITLLLAVGVALFFNGKISAEKIPDGVLTVNGNNIYRLYSPVTKAHLFTADKNEYDVLGTRGWVQEGVQWRDYKDGSKGAIDFVYRLYNPAIQRHLYTKDKNEYQILGSRGWVQEGVKFVSLPGREPYTFPIYRLYSPSLREHLYTKDYNEYTVLASRGWSQEGQAFDGFNP